MNDGTHIKNPPVLRKVLDCGSPLPLWRCTLPERKRQRTTAVQNAGALGRRLAFPSPSVGFVALTAIVLFALVAANALGQDPHSIVNSKHNLSIGGRGTIRSATESDICIFCHAPHNRTGPSPLWNHEMSGATYTPYSSSTLKATVGQPTGASKLCLSCHDGTVALGMVNSRSLPIPMQGGQSVISPGRTRIGTDLSGHHPISFTYDPALATAHGELRDPNTLVQEVRLDRNRQLQCTACHDPHRDQYGNFLVKDNTASALCLECHSQNQWNSSIHANSPATWNGNGQDPWPHTSGNNVAANACENCHRPHDAGTKPRLLNFTTEEQNCYSCHGGTVAAKNIATEFTKASVHPITQTSGIHTPNEDAINPPRHVECVDCHNPHAARNTTATAPTAPGSLAGVRGISSAGSVVKPLQNEYELCFCCHGDSGNRGPARVNRQYVQTNTRLEFNPANNSYHPIEAVGKNTSVPSLIPPWSTASRMYCSDCHNNNQGPDNNGTGPAGPHGSIYTPILERQLTLTDTGSYNSANSAMCYKCHSETSIRANTGFRRHSLHINRGYACTTCHDPHGVASKPHLINFNTTYVTPSSSGRLEYNSTGFRTGNCYLRCHGENHNPGRY